MSPLGTNKKLNRDAAHNERKPASGAVHEQARPAGAPRRESVPPSRAPAPATPRPPQDAERPARGHPPCGPLPAHAARPRTSPRARNRASIEKRPPRARRPALPQPSAAVLSAKAGLTAGFGMGPGDPRLCGRARGGRSPAAQVFEPARSPCRGDPGGRMAGTEEDRASRSVLLIEDAKSSGY